MATLQFRLSSRVSNGSAEVLVRFYDGSFGQRAKSHVYCPVQAWSDTEQMPVMPRRASGNVAAISEARQKLDQLREYIYTHWQREQYDAREGWLQQTIDDCFSIKPINAPETLRDVAEEYAVAKNIDAATKRQYRVLLDALERWAGKRILYVDRIRTEDIDDFVAFFRNEKTSDKTIARSQNTITSKLKRWRALQNFAVLRGYAETSPFLRYSIPAEVYGTPIFLTTEERDQLYAFADLPPALAVQRDIFVFQCHVGCRVSDLVSLTRENLTEDGFLQYIPQKQRRRTPMLVRVPLSQVAQEIIARYANEERKTLLPFIHPNKYDKAIHDLCRLAGLNRMVIVQNKTTMQAESKPLWEVTTSHTARKTFIEAMFRETKSERITSAFTGHTNGSRAFARYTDVDDEMKREILARLESKTK